MFILISLLIVFGCCYSLLFLLFLLFVVLLKMEQLLINFIDVINEIEKREEIHQPTTATTDNESIEYKSNFIKSNFKAKIMFANENYYYKLLDTTITNYKTINQIYEFLTSNFSKDIIERNRENTDPQYWKWIGILTHIYPSNVFKFYDTDNTEILPYIYYYKKAIELGDIESIYILSCIKYEDLYNRPLSHTEFCAKIKINVIPLLEKGKACGNLESIYFLAIIYLYFEQENLAKENLLILADHKYSKGIHLFSKIMYLYRPYLNELLCKSRTIRLAELINYPSPIMQRFLDIKNCNTNGECMVCYNDKPLICHDCNQISHALCIDCYSQTIKCPMCRYDIYTTVQTPQPNLVDILDVKEQLYNIFNDNYFCNNYHFDSRINTFVDDSIYTMTTPYIANENDIDTYHNLEIENIPPVLPINRNFTGILLQYGYRFPSPIQL